MTRPVAIELSPGTYTLPGGGLLQVMDDGAVLVRAMAAEQLVSTDVRTLQSMWIGKRLNYALFINELERLAYVSDGKWRGTGGQARGLHEFTQSHGLLPRMNQVRFFNLFRESFETQFKDVRSIQGTWSRFDDEFEKIFAAHLKNE